MESIQKEILLSTLNISLKFKNKDISCIEDINLLLSISVNNHDFVLSDILDKIQLLSDIDYTFAKSIIEGIDIPNKSYMLTKIEGLNIIRKLNISNNREYVSEFVRNTLDTDYSNLSDFEQFSLYQIIVKLSILEGASELITLAINKIQTL